MKKSNKTIAAMAAGIGIGYMAAKKQFDSKSPYHRFFEKLEDYID